MKRGDFQTNGGAVRIVKADANVAAAVGKISFSEEAIAENIKTFVDALMRAKPATAKGQYLKALSVSSTMGVGIKLDYQSLVADMKK